MEIIINDLKNTKKEEIKIDGLSQIPLIKGESAYDIAVSHGYTGTEEDWLKSIKYDDTKIKNDISNKVDKIEGKSLSTNDFTNEYKDKLDSLNNYDDTELKSELSKKVDKVEGKGLSSNDFTNECKNKLNELNNYDDTQIKEELSNKYVKNTDYASTSKAGVIKLNTASYGTEIDNNGMLKGVSRTFEQYSNGLYNSGFVSKGTLENVIAGKELINRTYVDNINETIAQQNKNLEEENLKLKSQIPSATASGNDIHIEDSGTLDFDWKIKGGHRQEIREGYNLLKVKNGKNINKYGLDVSIDDTGIITINGTSSGFYPTFLISGDGNIETRAGTPTIAENASWYNSIQLANQEYTLKFEYISGSGGSNSRPYVYIHKNDGTNLEFTQGNTTKIKNYTGDIGGVSFYVNDGTTYNNFKFRLYVVKGTYTSSNIPSYEPCGVSPSPDFPSEIETVNGSVEIDVVNKNIMPILNLGTSWEYTEKGIKNVEKNSGVLITKFNVKKGQVVKFGFELISKPIKDTSFTIYKNGINESFYSGFQQFDLNKLYERSFTANEDTTIEIKLWGNANSEIFEFKLWAEIDKLTDYSQHQSQTAIMPVQQEMLEGDYISDVERHEWVKKIFDGTETIRFSSNNNSFVYDTYDAKNYTGDKLPPLLCNSYKTVSWIDRNVNCLGNTISQYISSIGFDKGGLTTIEEFKEMLKSKYDAGNPVIVYYKLAEPIDLPLTEEQKAIRAQKLYAYKNITNINVDNELATIDVTYKKDLETEHNKIQNEINEIKQLLSTTQTSALLLDNLQKDVESEVE